MVGIYKIENKINGKVYVGQSRDILRRWRQHKVSRLQYPLYFAFQKYGINNFEFSVLEECDINLLNERESFYIQQYHSNKKEYGYNQSIDAQNNPHSIRFNQDDLLNLFDDLKNTELTQSELASKYGCSERTIRSINNGESLKDESLEYPIRVYWVGKDGKKYYSRSFQGTKLDNICPNCGGYKTAGSSLCVHCNHHSQTIGCYPDPSVIVNDITQLGFRGAGAKYGVTDNALRKHCAVIGLPTHTSDYKPKKSAPKDYTVLQINPDSNEIINEYPSPTAAARALGHNKGSHISEVCNGKLSQCYGFKWKYKFIS